MLRRGERHTATGAASSVLARPPCGALLFAQRSFAFAELVLAIVDLLAQLALASPDVVAPLLVQDAAFPRGQAGGVCLGRRLVELGGDLSPGVLRLLHRGDELLARLVGGLGRFHELILAVLSGNDDVERRKAAGGDARRAMDVVEHRGAYVVQIARAVSVANHGAELCPPET